MQAPEEDPIEPLRRIVGSARTDIQKVLAAVEKLRTLTNEAAINKMYVRSALVDLKLGVEGGKWTTLGALLTMGGPLMENADAAAKTSFTQSSSLILKFFEGVSAKVVSAISAVDSSGSGDDAKIRQIITDLYMPFMEFGIMFEKLAMGINIDPIGGLGWVSRMLETNKLSLDERWAAATCYLTAMEIAVNRAVKQLKVADNPNDEFGSRYNKVLEVMKERGKPLTGLKKQLPQAFWKLRNEVIHTGYSPTVQELEMVTHWVREMLHSLAEVN